MKFNMEKLMKKNLRATTTTKKDKWKNVILIEDREGYFKY